jgi:hypothetical protein
LQGRLNRRLYITWPLPDSSVFLHRGINGIQATIDEADYVVVQYRQTGFGDERREWMRRREPVYRLEHRGIPLVEIYAR